MYRHMAEVAPDGRTGADKPTRPLDTGIFAVAVGVISTMPPPVRCLQTLTAGALVFAILGACGFSPPSRRRPGIIRPRPPRSEITIRSLTGQWEAVRPMPDDTQVLRLSLVQRGDSLDGTLLVGGRTLASDPGSPARLDANGLFVLVFGQAPERVMMRGRPDVSGDRIPVTITGFGPEPLHLVFRRR